MSSQFQEILDELPRLEEGARALQEMLVTNLVMFGEIPGPTFQEEARTRFLTQRFTECGLQNCSTDGVGNGLGILPGEWGDRNLLVVAHADTVFPESVDHTVLVQPGAVTGPGVADNGLGLAALATLPTVLERLDIRLRANLVLMGGVRSLGRGDLEGIRFFLDHNQMPLHAGLCLEGVQLGRLGLGCIGMMRGEVRCGVPEEYDWTKLGATNAIITLNDVIRRVLEIPLPRVPRTTVILGSVEGGTGYDTIATEAVLRFEIRSESEDMVQEIRRRVENIAASVSAQSGERVELDVFAERKPGGLSFEHPLARCAREVMTGLQVALRVSPSMSELSAFAARGIPAITLGVTSGERIGTEKETAALDPMARGMAQILGVLLAVDKGLCDEE